MSVHAIRPGEPALSLEDAERERRFRETQVRESVKMEALSNLAAGIANDFNNALAAISASVELAWMHLPPTEEAALQELSVAREASRRAARLVRRLFNCARPAPSVRRPLDPRSVVLHATSALRRELEASYEVETRFGHGDWRIDADFEQLTDILLNLGYNARDAMQGGGRITIATSRVSADDRDGIPLDVPRGRDFVRLDVSDHGTGIEPGVLPRIFEPFFTTKETGRGAGLGLAMVYGVLRQHEGGITVESSVGEGSVFRLFLPRAERVTSVASVTSLPVAARRTAETILIVDNEADIRYTMRAGLEQAGMVVGEAADGAEGLAFLERVKGEVGLVILDVVMPNLSGWEVLAEIRKRWPGVAVVMTSGYTPDVAPTGVQPDVFLTKPYALSTLVREVRRVLEREG